MNWEDDDMGQRNPLDRSAAFTTLLELDPGFRKLSDPEAEAEIAELLHDFYEAADTDLHRRQVTQGRTQGVLTAKHNRRSK